MPRTKVAKNSAAKRNRNSHNDEALQNKLRDFDVLCEGIRASLDQQYNDLQEQLRSHFKLLRSRTPKHILNMKVGDLKKHGLSFDDLGKSKFTSQVDSSNEIQNSSSNLSMESSSDIFSTNKFSRGDEGYSTEGSSKQTLQVPPIPSLKQQPPQHRIGPLAASAMKNRRRSKSFSSTPLKSRTFLSSIQSKKLLASNDNRASRSKFRTPNNRLQTLSTDRGLGIITPKVAPNTPLAIVRHARAGENVYSITGSPVITSSAISDIANVNIPVANGILSIRPQGILDLDPETIPPIDSTTLEDIKQLQNNLNLIMKAVGNMKP
uniref:Putative cell division cycle-associated protein 8 n=1 Tax=Corethrella appendiculata TaxID=1370023 RepID=U5ENX5_9DIPT